MIHTMRLTLSDLGAGAGMGAVVYLLLGPAFGVGFVVAFVVTSSLGWALLGGVVTAVALVVTVLIVGVKLATDR